MRWTLALGVALLTAAPALAQENEAEKLFRAMEKKVREAKTLKVAGEIEAKFNQGGTLKFTALIGEGNKARLEMTGNIDGMALKILLVSDGKNTLVSGEPFGKNDSRATDEKQNQQLVAMTNRGGLFFAAMFSTVAGMGNDVGDVDRSFAVSDFKMGRKEMVGDKEATVFTFKMKVPGGGAEEALVTIWLDPATRLPLKRKLEAIGDKNKGEFLVESYSQFQVNPRLEDGHFTLPKEKN
jgi:outer membrane lipoprotein-sorting protein